MLGCYMERTRCRLGRNGRFCADGRCGESMTARYAKRAEARQVARDVAEELAGADIGGGPWADDRDSGPCSHCGGEPEMQECDDPIQCCSPRCDGYWHPCEACGATGLAKYQVIW